MVTFPMHTPRLRPRRALCRQAHSPHRQPWWIQDLCLPRHRPWCPYRSRLLDSGNHVRETQEPKGYFTWKGYRGVHHHQGR